MPELARLLAVPATLALMIAAMPSPAQQSKATTAAPPIVTQQTPMQQQTGGPPSLETLLQQFDARVPAPPGSVRLDAWVETGDAGQEVVVLVAPEGDAKLVADPGITVTPAARPGVDWRLPLPHRLVDTERDYFDPPAMIRLPFTSADGQPLQLLVEYAYCFVDFQCFFGEAELTVATAAP
ncbi:MAG: hypothetical protein ACREJ0_14595 [Geminicoccaceae bacterium]